MIEDYDPCPRCHKTVGKYPALCRRDNKTSICSDCGQAQAMEDMLMAVVAENLDRQHKGVDWNSDSDPLTN